MGLVCYPQTLRPPPWSESLDKPLTVPGVHRRFQHSQCRSSYRLGQNNDTHWKTDVAQPCRTDIVQPFGSSSGHRRQTKLIRTITRASNNLLAGPRQPPLDRKERARINVGVGPRHCTTVKALRFALSLFPQIDIIGEGKLSGLFSAVGLLCATIVHSELHTHMNRPNSSLDLVLSHWAHFTVLRFIFVYVLFCVWLYIACMRSIVAWWGGPGGIEAWSLGPLLPSVLWHCWWVIWPVKPVPNMTYNVFSGTLNPTQSNLRFAPWWPVRISMLYWIVCPVSNLNS